MKHSTVLAAVMSIGLAFHAHAADPVNLYWVGSSSADAYANFRTGSNWNPSRTPGNSDTVWFTNGTVYVNLDRPTDTADSKGSYAYVYHNITNATVYFSTTNGVGELQEWKPRSLNVQDGGKLVMNGVYLSRYGKTNWTIDGDKIAFAQGSANYIKPYESDNYTADLNGDLTLFVVGNKRVNFSGNNIGFTGKIISMTTESTSGGAPRGVVFGGMDTAFPAGTLQIDDGCCSFLNGIQSGEFAMGELTGTGKLGVDGGTDGVELVLNLGGKNTSFTSGVSFIRYTANSPAASVRKVGTGTLDFQIAGCRNLYIDAGKVAMVTAGRIPNSNSPYIKFGGGSLTDSEGKTLVDVSSLIKNSASPISIDIANNATFATQIGNSNVGGLVKRGAGTLTLSAVPAYTGTTVLEDGTLVVPQGTTIAELSALGGKLTVPFAGTENETQVLTIASLADGTTVEKLTEAVTVAGATVSVESGAAGYVVKATRTSQTFVWTGAQGTDWGAGANWTVGGVAASTAPLAIDTVSFPSALGDKTNVVLLARATVAEVIADSDVAISGAQICSPMYRGDGKLVLGDGAGFYVNAGTVVSNDIEIAGSVVVTPSTTYITTKFYGDFTGSGTLTFGGERPNYELAGDNSGFTGTIVALKDANDRNGITLSAVSAGASNAIWKVYSSGGGDFTSVKGGLFKFGSLSGAVAYFDQSNVQDQTIEVGHLGLDDTLGGRWFNSKYIHLVVDSNQTDRTDSSNRGHCLRKVGNGTLSFDGQYLRKYEINGGTLVITADDAFVWTKDETTYRSRFSFGGGTLAFGDGVTGDPSSRIVGSSSPICFSNGVNEVHTWASELSSSNVGGLTKLGAGTLTLETAPLYTGWTTVKAGKLIVPEGTALDVVAGAGGEIEGATTNNLAFVEDYTFNTASDSTIVATGAADVSNLTVYIANPTASGSINVVKAGSFTGTATLAFPPETSDKAKAKWSLKVSNGLLKASSISPMVVILR